MFELRSALTAAVLGGGLLSAGCSDRVPPPTGARRSLGGLSADAAAGPLNPSKEGEALAAANAPGGASAAVSEAPTTAGGTPLLLLADVDNAGTTALANALSSAGFAVTHRPAPEYTWDGVNPPPDQFACVVHLDGATFFAPLPVPAQHALENYVQSGGGFIASQWDGFELAVGQQTEMPDLVLQLWATGNTDNCGACNITYTAVPSELGHPVLAGVPSSFGFFADGHDAGALVSFATSPSTVLMTATSGGPGVIVREFGQGRVVNFSHAANFSSIGLTLQDPNIQRLYTNAADWACGGLQLQVGVDIKPGSADNPVQLGSSGMLPVALLSTQVAKGEPSEFDAREADPSTITLGNDDGSDTHVATRPNGTPMASLEDVDGDGDLDLIMQFRIPALEANGDLTASTTGLVLNGTRSTDGRRFKGSDHVRILPTP